MAPALPANTVAGKPVEPGELTSTNSIAANLPEATLPEAAQVQSAPDGFALPFPWRAL